MDHYLIQWNEALSIGNDDIDAQHRKLIEMMATIPEKEAKRDYILLEDTLKYAAMHFSEEEAYMASIDYPHLDTHAREHKALTRILMSYLKDLQNDEIDMYAFKQFMFRWIRDHIMDTDARIGQYVRLISP